MICNDSLQQFLTCSRGRINEKKVLGPKFEANGSKSVLKVVFFCHFVEFSSLILLEIACNDSLQQCLTYSKG